MSIENIIPKKGEVWFLWFNRCSGIVLKTPSRVLVFDPAEVNPTIFRKVDAILITHEHYDHLDVPLVRSVHGRTGCQVIADQTSVRKLRDAVSSDKLHAASVGSDFKIGEAHIAALGFKHPATAPVSFLVTTEDGIRIYHTGDSLPFPEMKRLGEQTPPDVVFCTVGPPAPGASPQTGLEIVEMVHPKMAFPYHAPISEARKFADLMSRKTPKVRCAIIEQGKPFKYP
ncbi:MAG: MBL fold metallo-hydrolase [Candidatus Bathyarchaeota archaeon]|nr:MBL fold metallo-hydrolase [Candidatus Bathyarchaeota archaeon]